MRPHLASVALLTAACLSPPDTGTEEDPIVVCYYDCPICYPACGPCAQVCATCPVITPPPDPAGDLPFGLWEGEWHCNGGCQKNSVPLLMTAKSVEISVGPVAQALVWRDDPNSFPVLESLVLDEDNCWVMKPPSNACRSEIRLCGAYCEQGTPCVRVGSATFTDLITGHQQVWSFTAY